ncbi:helix-turn-helix domain-containing protein [Amnibacterium kyonggiense]|nr:helix-turn-helix transcriptional regulator [Amnibacterium kyonggiense]
MAPERQRGNEIGPTGLTVAFNLRRLRTSAGLDLRLMSKRLSDLGRPISPAALSRIENLERRVDSDDLVVMALALEVNPNALLLPPTGHPAKVIELGPTVRVNADEAWRWARGEHTIGTDAAGRTAMEEALEVAPGTPAAERWAIIRELLEAEHMKFRARVTPGTPSDAGPSVSDDPGGDRG